MNDIRDGLSRALLVPQGTGWADIQAGYTKAVGAYGRAEVGRRLMAKAGVYAFGQLSQRETMAGIGVRAVW